ncbi:hypothetical protein DBV15_11991 [Temnothorax longispinosus]|uniref:Uncharacterized protein n=1 Tax=Temnothorax longispinosus TaxID=300112 RepID=A0A4S2KLP5_9HYME|nr:hypothetical protein DBV15_11991 [Temnothorax longispinosus]
MRELDTESPVVWPAWCYTELNIGCRSKYKRDYARAGDWYTRVLLPSASNLFMDHKASASVSDCRFLRILFPLPTHRDPIPVDPASGYQLFLVFIVSDS